MQGLRAFARVYAGWAMSQAFYRERLWAPIGFASLEDYLVRAWEGNFLRRSGEDLVSMIDTWYHSDISDNTLYSGDLTRALGAITARSIIMPSTTDLYFTLADSEAETRLMPNAELRPIQSIWGHRAGNPLQVARGRGHAADGGAGPSGELSRLLRRRKAPATCSKPRRLYFRRSVARCECTKTMGSAHLACRIAGLSECIPKTASSLKALTGKANCRLARMGKITRSIRSRAWYSQGPILARLAHCMRLFA